MIRNRVSGRYSLAEILPFNNKERIIFGKDVPVKPGDLILWRYNNEHGVGSIETEPDQLGFMRIIFPPEDIPFRVLAQNASNKSDEATKIYSRLRSKLGAVKRRLFSK